MQDTRLDPTADTSGNNMPDAEVMAFLTPLGIRLEAPTLQSNQTYVIVETLLESDIRGLLARQNVFDVRIAKLFKHTPYDALADKGPVIALVPSKNNAFNDLMAAFQNTPSGCFIHSVLPFDDMLDWARQRLTAHKDKVPALLRFYEPRMLLPLLSSWEWETKQAFLKDIDAIHWFDQRWLSQYTQDVFVSSQDDHLKNTDRRPQDDTLEQPNVMKWLLTKAHLNTASTNQQEWTILNDRNDRHV